MTSPSPSEFLTFMRYASVRGSLRPSTISPACRAAPRYTSLLASTQARRLSTSTQYYSPLSPQKERELDRQHAQNKDGLDVQSDASRSGKEAKTKGGTDTATKQSDPTSSKDRAAKEFPEAPKGTVAIGMQDERGRKGH